MHTAVPGVMRVAGWRCYRPGRALSRSPPCYGRRRNERPEVVRAHGVAYVGVQLARPSVIGGAASTSYTTTRLHHQGIPKRDMVRVYCTALSQKAKPVKTLDRLRRDILIPAIPSQGTSTWSHCIGLSGCPGVPGWNGPRNRSGVQIV